MFSEYKHCQCGYDDDPTVAECFCHLDQSMPSNATTTKDNNIVTVVADELSFEKSVENFDATFSDVYMLGKQYELNDRKHFEEKLNSKFSYNDNILNYNDDDYKINEPTKFNLGVNQDETMESIQHDGKKIKKIKPDLDAVNKTKNNDNARDARWLNQNSNKSLFKTSLIQETDLTKQLKLEIQSFEKRNVDLIIEVEKLRLQLKQQQSRHSTETDHLSTLLDENKKLKNELEASFNKSETLVEKLNELELMRMSDQDHISHLEASIKVLREDLKEVKLKKLRYQLPHHDQKYFESDATSNGLYYRNFESVISESYDDRCKMYELLGNFFRSPENNAMSFKEMNTNFEEDEDREIMRKIFDSRRQDLLQKLTCFEDIQHSIKLFLF
ncbi:hypothetical protein HELRODRAFT_158796 [Helobdella robusta]|uniref:Uncharacterized protein n=1 Tax=Helobdella robusta TaxID=6412 RepID=T1ENA0_HELRO|nr:hypothetical protein HELRODRAFT_158796 [Helobdella robusta]ESO12309.1 hypothetical protein HELRODRAFT_158796 [Helobdella robusta]